MLFGIKHKYVYSKELSDTVLGTIRKIKIRLLSKCLLVRTEDIRYRVSLCQL